MFNGKIRVGVIGIGRFSFTNHIPNLRKTGKAEVVAISRRNYQALKDAQKLLAVPRAYTDWRELLEKEELDAVIISTAHHVLAEPALAALNRGLHVLLEKPMALTSKDAWSIVRVAEHSSKVLVVGFKERCFGIWRTVKKALDDGCIGTIRQINVAYSQGGQFFWEPECLFPQSIQEYLRSQGIPDSFGFYKPLAKDYWRCNPTERGGGFFADGGSHKVDLALWLGGSYPVTVSAIAESDGLPIEHHIVAQVKLANGILVSLGSVDGVGEPLQFYSRLTVFGDRGVVDTDGSKIFIKSSNGLRQLKSGTPDSNTAAEFISGIEGGVIYLTSAQEGAHVVSSIEAAYRSTKERRVISIDYP